MNRIHVRASDGTDITYDGEHRFQYGDRGLVIISKAGKVIAMYWRPIFIRNDYI